jgi:hypothetical protein
MSADDLLFVVIVVGFLMSMCYVRAEFRAHRARKAFELQRLMQHQNNSQRPAKPRSSLAMAECTNE